MADKYYISSDDASIYVKEASDYVSTYVLLELPGMWGSAMFGSPSLLGAGDLSNVLSSLGRYVQSEDLGMYVVRRPIIIYISIMSTAPGMWGSNMFGSQNVLGTGSLNSVEA
jgi:hypothetical protein